MEDLLKDLFLTYRLREKQPQRRLKFLVRYLLISLFAEFAFVLMAIKEYLQDLLRVSEQELILTAGSPKAKGKNAT